MRIHHVALRTTDLGRLERFYVEILGLPVIRRTGERSIWLDAAGAILMLEAKEPSEPAIPEGTNELVAFAVDPQEHALYTERIERAGIPIEGRTAYSMYFRDPDGRRVGLSSYPEPAAPLTAPPAR